MKSTFVLRSSVALALFAGIYGSAPAQAAVIWKADFETGDISQFNGNVNATKGTRKNIEIITDPVQQGTSAGRFTIHEDDTFSTTQMRVQITRNTNRTGEGQDVFMSFWFFLESAPKFRDNIAYWESNSSFRNMMTWWLAPKAGGGTTFDFGTGSLGSTKHIYSGDIALMRWHQVAYHVHWSTNAQMGHIIVWLDGAKIVDENAQTKADGNSMFFQSGIHRGSRSPLVDSIVFDNYIEADSVADLMVADPDAGVPARDAATSDASADGASATDGGGAGGMGGSAGGGAGSGSAGSGGSIGAGGSVGSGGSSVAGSGGSAVTGSGGGSVAGSGGSAAGAGSGTGGTQGSAGSAARPEVVDEGLSCTIAPIGRPSAPRRIALAALLGGALLARRRRNARSTAGSGRTCRG